MELQQLAGLADSFESSKKKKSKTIRIILAKLFGNLGSSVVATDYHLREKETVIQFYRLSGCDFSIAVISFLLAYLLYAVFILIIHFSVG